MAKTKSVYICQNCGIQSPKWVGRCSSCGEWNTFVEEVISTEKASLRVMPGNISKPRLISEIVLSDQERIDTGNSEFNRVTGGGIVPGSLILLGGEPGIGKSTLVLQIAMNLSDRKILYISGEESLQQLKMRANRLPGNNSQCLFLCETSLETILMQIDNEKPDLVIIDSIQTVYIPEVSSSAGSVTQVRECSARLRELAKSSGIAVFVIGHVTKEGVIAGPRVLEHIVDTVLYLEGDRYQAFRLLRSVKNRFGPTSEVGVFEMRGNGMIEVPNPSEAFLAERMVNAPGSTIVVTMEGTRPLLVELQGLTSPTQFGNARRTPNGVDFNRLLLVAAVLTRRLGLNLSEQDIFINVVGGLRIDEPAADLAIATAIASSMKDIPVKADAVLLGEIGLSGELRWVNQLEARLKEAAKLGFKTAIVPRRLHKGEPWPEGIKVIEARSVKEAIQAALKEEKP